MILYHGSNVEVRSPKLIHLERGRDFGMAFYLTPIKVQAEKWSQIKTIREGSGIPIVSCFEWDEDLNNLEYLKFKDADGEWLDFIVKCRSDFKFKHQYDLVEGKIADDTVGETVTFYLEKIITREQAIEKLKYQKKNSQIAFCSEKSLTHLKFKESYRVK